MALLVSKTTTMHQQYCVALGKAKQVADAPQRLHLRLLAWSIDGKSTLQVR